MSWISSGSNGPRQHIGGCDKHYRSDRGYEHPLSDTIWDGFFVAKNEIECFFPRGQDRGE